jgi:hypothetical protein
LDISHPCKEYTTGVEFKEGFQREKDCLGDFQFSWAGRSCLLQTDQGRGTLRPKEGQKRGTLRPKEGQKRGTLRPKEGQKRGTLRPLGGVL